MSESNEFGDYIPKPAPAPSRGPPKTEDIPVFVRVIDVLDKIATDDLKTELEYRLGAPAPADTVPVSREWLERLRNDFWAGRYPGGANLAWEIDHLLAEGAQAGQHIAEEIADCPDEPNTFERRHGP